MKEIIIGVVALLVGIFIGYVIRKNLAEKKVGSAEMQAKNIVLDAENRAEQIRRETLAEADDEDGVLLTEGLTGGDTRLTIIA